MLAKIGVLQMPDPGNEADLALDDGAQPSIGVRAVTGNAWKELRHKPGMVELLFLGRAQVRLGTGHPQNVALHDHFPVARRFGVVVQQPILCEREQAVDAAVDKPVWDSRFVIQVMRERAVWQNVFTPDHRIAEDDDFAGCSRLAQPPAIEPIVFAELVGNSVVGSGIHPFDVLPEPWCQQHDQADNNNGREPLPAAEPHFVHAEWDFRQNGLRAGLRVG